MLLSSDNCEATLLYKINYSQMPLYHTSSNPRAAVVAFDMYIALSDAG